METYDEDLSENLFFQELNSQIDNFQEKAAAQQWIVCIPQSGRVPKLGVQLDDIENHILIGDSEKENAYKTLNGKMVMIQDSVISTGDDFRDNQNVRILFEETFYMKNGQSFLILCLEKMLDGCSIGMKTDGIIEYELTSLKHCVDILYREVGDQRILHQVDQYIEKWNKKNHNLEFETIQSMKGLTSALYTKILQAIFKDSILKKKIWTNKFLMDSMKLAIETFTLHGVYKTLMKGLTAYMAQEDSQLNKTIRNMSGLQVKDLNIKLHFNSKIPRAKQELCRIEWFTTPLDKIVCIKKAISVLTKRTECSVAADVLLPILVYLVLKSGLPNWLANLNFMKQFRLSQMDKEYEKDEYGYFLTSLEAALEHIRSGYLLGSGLPESQLELSSNDGNIFPELYELPLLEDSVSDEVKSLFEHTRAGNWDKMQSILSQTTSVQEETIFQLCHPLCACEICEKKQKEKKREFLPNLHSRNTKGRTVLHVASEFGKYTIIENLIAMQAPVNTVDFNGQTPLHLACQRGHQNAILLLLHNGALVNIVDNDGNTPLHLSALNGHEDCVKALLYCDEYMHNCSIQVNATNDNGDTPLHFAARWGYGTIVETLLEFGACVETQNKRQQTPLDCSHNVNVTHLLEGATGTFRVIYHEGFLNVESCSSVDGSAVVHEIIDQDDTVSQGTLKKWNKLIKAVVQGDINLACFYLGLECVDNQNDANDSKAKSPGLCHPLCQCQQCAPLQKVPQFHLASKEDLSVNCTGPDGQTPLHVACKHGQRILAEILLENGANVNARSTHQGFTPLHVACQQDHKEVAQLLLRHEASVNLRDSLGRTPLYICCLNDHIAVAATLLKTRASVDQCSHDGTTPLHEAALANRFPLVELLLHHGADPARIYKKQLTAEDLATDGSVKRLLHESRKKMQNSPSVPSIISATEKEASVCQRRRNQSQ